MMTTMRRPGYEVAGDVIEVIDSRGFPHWLSPGQPLPEWVDDDRIAELLELGALDTFELI